MRLTLGSGPVTSAGLAHLRGLSARLVRLGLRSTRVRDLGPIGHLAGLQHLYLSRSPIDDAGLAPAGRLTSLQELELHETRVGGGSLCSPAELAAVAPDSRL